MECIEYMEFIKIECIKIEYIKYFLIVMAGLFAIVLPPFLIVVAIEIFDFYKIIYKDIKEFIKDRWNI